MNAVARFRRGRGRTTTQGAQGRTDTGMISLANRRRTRGLVTFLAIPAVVFGTATAAAAFGFGRLVDGSPQTCDDVTVAAPAADSFGIRVYNASEEQGAAATVGKALGQRGFHVAEVANQPGLMSRYTRILYGKDGTDQALYVATQFPHAQTEYDGRAGNSVAVVLGVQGRDLVPVAPPAPPLPDAIHVNVFNTTFRAGLAADIAGQLRDRGFRTDDVGNDPNGSYLPDDVAAIRYGEDGAAAAKVLAQHVPGAKLVQDHRSGSAVDLVTGNRYSALTPVDQVPAPAPEQPKQTPMITRPCANNG